MIWLNCFSYKALINLNLKRIIKSPPDCFTSMLYFSQTKMPWIEYNYSAFSFFHPDIPQILEFFYFSVTQQSSLQDFKTPFSPQVLAWPRGFMWKHENSLNLGQALIFPHEVYESRVENSTIIATLNSVPFITKFILSEIT